MNNQEYDLKRLMRPPTPEAVPPPTPAAAPPAAAPPPTPAAAPIAPIAPMISDLQKVDAIDAIDAFDADINSEFYYKVHENMYVKGVITAIKHHQPPYMKPGEDYYTYTINGRERYDIYSLRQHQPAINPPIPPSTPQYLTFYNVIYQIAQVGKNYYYKDHENGYKSGLLSHKGNDEGGSFYVINGNRISSIYDRTNDGGGRRSHRRGRGQGRSRGRWRSTHHRRR